MRRKQMMVAVVMGGMMAVGIARAGEDRGAFGPHRQNEKGSSLLPKFSESDKIPHRSTHQGAWGRDKVVKPAPKPAPVNTVCPVTKKPVGKARVMRTWKGNEVALRSAKAAARWDKFSDARKAKRLAAVTKGKNQQ